MALSAYLPLAHFLPSSVRPVISLHIWHSYEEGWQKGTLCVELVVIEWVDRTCSCCFSVCFFLSSRFFGFGHRTKLGFRAILLLTCELLFSFFYCHDTLHFLRSDQPLSSKVLIWSSTLSTFDETLEGPLLPFTTVSEMWCAHHHG